MLFDENIKSIEESIKSLSAEVERVQLGTEDFDIESAFSAMFFLSILKKQLLEADNAINELATQWMRVNGEKVHAFGTHVLERKVSSRRKNWQHDVLLEAVINTSLKDENNQVINPQTGEMVDLIEVSKPLIDAVVRNLTAAAAIREWRTTALKNIVPGLNPDDFCEVEKAERVSIMRK